MSDSVKTARLDAIPTLNPEPGEPEWKPIRMHLGIDAFGVNAWIATEAGQQVIERHTETEDSDTGHEELYLVARGSASFTVDGEQVEAPEGTLVFVPDPGSVREAVATEAGTVIFVVGGTAGEAFRPSDWEIKHA